VSFFESALTKARLSRVLKLLCVQI